MQMKKVVSLVMALVMLLTIAIVPTAFTAADKDAAATSVNTTTDYGLAPNIQSGNILHAFNWRMRDLVKYAPEIAAAGYTSVQISPVQYTKATVNDGSYATDWWSFYQPRDMSIGNALGTADEVEEATSVLHSYGIKVIADVVTNHVQNCAKRTDSADVNATLRGYTRNSNLLTHTLNADDSDRRHQVQGDLDNQLPDINTGNSAYQQYVIDNLLNPLADRGVDGFRFDAAKHIETPDDGSYASNYWPTITSAIKSKNSNAYIYGEILSSAGKFSITSYTKYINVTDYAFGETVRNSLGNKNASNLVNYGYTGSSANQNVLWVESHDNFCSGSSTGLSKKQQILGWAVVGSRKDAPALFYVRPKHEQIDSPGFIKYDDLMGAPGSAETWKDPTVVAVNHFKNAFAGQTESTTASGSNLFVQRGTTGMVIVNLNGSSTTVNQSCSMTAGSYTDQVSGTTFQVSGGKISGTVGSTGVAVIYNTTAANTAPEIKLSLNGTELTPEVLSRYTEATATVKVDLKNATSADIKVSNLAAVTVNGSTTFTLNSSIPYGKSVDVKITATNGQKTVERTYNIKKKNPNETKKVYFDNSVMKWPYESTTGSQTVGIFVMCKTGLAPSTKIGTYDSNKMTPVSGQTDLYSFTVPSNTKYVKFNEGFIGSAYTDKSHADSYGRCHLFHTFNECGGYCGRTMPETVVNFGTANSASNRENGGYELVGAMILKDLRFEDYGDYPVATLTSADTSLSGEPTPPEPTDPPTEPPTEPPVGRPILRGDADQDTFVSVLDATMMQRHIAKIRTLSDDGVLAADIDSNNKLETVDVTLLQRFLAGMGNKYHVNEIFYVDGEAPNPTTAPEPTSAPTPTTAPEPTESGEAKPLVKLPNKFVAVVYCEAAGTDDASRNSEHNFDEYGRLTYEFQGPSYVFARNYDTGVQYCTDGWSNFANPVTLVNQANLTSTFDKMYVPAGTHTLYLQPGEGDTYTLEYDGNYKLPSGGNTDPTSAPVPDTVTIYFRNDKNWSSVKAHMWNDMGGTTTWPGIAATPEGGKYYSVTMNTGEYDHVIFNGTGGQTVDLAVSDILAGGNNGVYPLSTQNNLGHYNVAYFTYDGSNTN